MGRLNGNSAERVGHPTQKPRQVIQRLIRGLSYPGSTVLDFLLAAVLRQGLRLRKVGTSICGDLDDTFQSCVSRQIEMMDTCDLFKAFPKFVISTKLGKDHPIFGKG